MKPIKFAAGLCLLQLLDSCQKQIEISKITPPPVMEQMNPI
jgi:hypothetical protein